MPPLDSLLRAAHPVPVTAVTALTGALIVARGADPGAAALGVGSTLAGQLSIGWSNDYLDREEDAAVGRRDKPLARGQLRPGVVWRAAWVALAACLVLSALLGMAEAAVMGAAVASAWAYNAVLKRTWLSWLPYAVSFGLAPVYVWLVVEEGWPPGWVVLGAALLGLAGHLTNVLQDLPAERARGSRGLPHRLGARASLAAARATTLSTAMTAAVVVAGIAGRTRLAFLLTIAAAAGVVAMFLLSAAGRPTP